MRARSVLALLALCPCSLAQVGPDPVLLYTIPDPGPGIAISWGEGLESGPDLTGDGVPECLIPRIDAGENVSLHIYDPVVRQYVQVLSDFGRRLGANGAVGQGENRFPDVFAGSPGDVDGDGTDDIYFANPMIAEGPDLAMVWIISGSDYSYIHEISIPGGDFAGFFFGALGDLDQDGKDEFSIHHRSLYFEIASGADGGALYTIGTVSGGAYGARSVGDINGDGVNDIVYAIQEDQPFRAGAIISGADGTSLEYFTWNLRCFQYQGDGGCDPGHPGGDGIALPIVLNDVDGDSLSDVAFFQPDARMEVRAFSSGTGDLLWVRDPNCARCFDEEGASVGTTVEDMNGDGVAELAISAEAQQYQSVFSGADGSYLLHRGDSVPSYDQRWQSIGYLGRVDSHCYVTIVCNELGEVLVQSYQPCLSVDPPTRKEKIGSANSAFPQ